MSGFGKNVAKMLTQTGLNVDSVKEAVAMFEQFAVCGSPAEIIYVRILVSLISRRTETAFALEKFTAAVSLYSASGESLCSRVLCQTVFILAQLVLNSDDSLKLMVKQRISEQSSQSVAEVKASQQAGPKIELKMNFSNYVWTSKTTATILTTTLVFPSLPSRRSRIPYISMDQCNKHAFLINYSRVSTCSTGTMFPLMTL